MAFTPMASPIVLVIDDLDSVTDFVVEALNGFGYPAIGALDGRQTHEIVNTTPTLRLLICDVYLGEVTGPELIRQVMRARPDLKVIFMSGGTESSPVRHTDPFLKKPFDLKTLRSLVVNALTETETKLDGQAPPEGERRRSRAP
jgi:DNA-binding NtrC family response regulator